MPTRTSTPASAGQLGLLILLGAGFWLTGVVIVRIIEPLGALTGTWRALSYALLVPGTLPAIWLTRRLAHVSRGEILAAVGVVTAAALVLDGIVFGWMPWIYAPDTEGQLHAAAFILWGGAVGLVLALISQLREAR